MTSKYALILLPLLAAHGGLAAASPSLPDYSGTYACKGHDASEGEYSGTVTLKLNRRHSADGYAAYDFKLEVPGFGAYPGHAAAKGEHMAIYFANTDPKTRDFGTGIAAFSKNKDGKWRFNKFYYEPEFKDGNHGTEECVQR
jgi:hypothetical protein